jgi:hypothetical protein
MEKLWKFCVQNFITCWPFKALWLLHRTHSFLKGVRCGTVGWGTTSRKVAGSIADDVTGIVHPHNASGQRLRWYTG